MSSTASSSHEDSFVTATATSSPPPPPLVYTPGALLACVARLMAAQDEMEISTHGGLRVRLRYGCGENDYSFDVSLMEDTRTARALENDVKFDMDSDDEDEDSHVVNVFGFDATDAPAVLAAVQFMNDLDAWTVCGCGDHLIKDRADVCYCCELTRRPDDVQRETCPICHADGPPRWMTAAPCCGQRLHRACYRLCLEGNQRCPMCRGTA